MNKVVDIASKKKKPKEKEVRTIRTVTVLKDTRNGMLCVITTPDDLQDSTEGRIEMVQMMADTISDICEVDPAVYEARHGDTNES